MQVWKSLSSRHYNKTARDLPSLNAGQVVYFQLDSGKEWQKGTIKRKETTRSYVIQANYDNKVYRRNRVFIRPAGNTHDLPAAQPDTVEWTFPDPEPPDPVALDPVAVPQATLDRPQRTRREPGWMRDYAC